MTLQAEFYRLQDQHTGGVYEGYVLYGKVYRITYLCFDTFRLLTTGKADAKYWIFLN